MFYPKDRIVHRTLLSGLEPRIQQIAQALAEQIECKDGEHERNTGEDGQPRSDGNVAHGVGQQQSPVRRRRHGAEAQERERGGVHNGRGDRQRRQDDDGRHDVGQDVAHHQGKVRFVEGGAGLYKGHVLQRLRLRTDRSGIRSPADDGDGDDTKVKVTVKKDETSEPNKLKYVLKLEHVSDPQFDFSAWGSDEPGKLSAVFEEVKYE